MSDEYCRVGLVAMARLGLRVLVLLRGKSQHLLRCVPANSKTGIEIMLIEEERYELSLSMGCKPSS
jgi:hypothetical protein